MCGVEARKWDAHRRWIEEKQQPAAGRERGSGGMRRAAVHLCYCSFGVRGRRGANDRRERPATRCGTLRGIGGSHRVLCRGEGPMGRRITPAGEVLGGGEWLGSAGIRRRVSAGCCRWDLLATAQVRIPVLVSNCASFSNERLSFLHLAHLICGPRVEVSCLSAEKEPTKRRGTAAPTAGQALFLGATAE